METHANVSTNGDLSISGDVDFREFFNRYILDDPHKPLNSYQKRLLDMIYDGPPNQERPKIYIHMARQSGRDYLWKWLEEESILDILIESYTDQLRRCNPAIGYGIDWFGIDELKGESNA